MALTSAAGAGNRAALSGKIIRWSADDLGDRDHQNDRYLVSDSSTIRWPCSTLLVA
jgi:hypothetical protein